MPDLKTFILPEAIRGGNVYPKREIILVVRKSVVSLRREYPPSLFTMLKQAGRFILYAYESKIPIISHMLHNPVYPWINPSATDMKRIYFRICIIRYLLFSVSPNNSFTEKLKSLLAEYPAIDIKAMGFPAGRQSEPLWQ